MKKAAFVTIHGMGKTDANYADSIFQSVRKLLRGDADLVSFQSIFYDKPLQQREETVFANMLTNHKLRWNSMREIALYGLSEAIALEARSEEPDSDYAVAQRSIAKTLLDAARELDSTKRPVVLLAHSLGCQVMSNYIWDAQATAPTAGVWAAPALLKSDLDATDEEIDFLRLKTLVSLVTTGCNIPVFVAALAKTGISTIKPTNASFQWNNYFDLDDVLGYPLQELSDGYNALVADHEVNAGGILQSWNPLSHNEYWSDSDVLEPLVGFVRGAIQMPEVV